MMFTPTSLTMVVSLIMWEASINLSLTVEYPRSTLTSEDRRRRLKMECREVLLESGHLLHILLSQEPQVSKSPVVETIRSL